MNTIRLALLGMIAGICLLTLSTDPASAGNSLRDPVQIRKGVELFLQESQNLDPEKSATPDRRDLSATDLNEIAEGLADLIALQNADNSNLLLAELGDLYLNQPRFRPAIEDLMSKIERRVHEQIEAAATAQNPAFNVLDQVFNAFWISYSFGVFDGFRGTAGQGLKWAERLRIALKDGFRNMPGGKNAGLIIIGMGTTAGLAKTAWEQQRTPKISPEEILAGVQGRLALQLATRTVEIRDELRLTRDRAGALSRAERSHLSDLDREVSQIQEQLKFLFRSVPELTHLRATTQQDLQEIKSLLDMLS